MAFDVRSESRASLDLSPAARTTSGTVTPARSIETAERWRLEIESVSAGSDGSSVLAARIEPAEGEVEDEGAGQTKTAKPAETLLIRVSPRCSIQEFGWRTDADPRVAYRQQMRVASLSYWAPSATDDSSEYEGSAFDSNGDYDARYRYDGGGRILARVTDYRPGPGASRGLMPVELEVARSAITIELADGAWFERIESRTRVQFTVAGTPVGFRDQTVDASRVEPGEWRPDVALDDGGWRWGRLSAPPRSSADHFDPGLQGVPIDDALTRYRELLADAERPLGHSEYLRDWLRANPGGAGTLLEQLREGAFEGSQQERVGVFLALSTSGTPEARGVLIDLVGSDEDRVLHQIAAARAFASVELPTPQLVEVLIAASGRADLHPIERGSMALALGMFADAAQARSPELAAQARAEIAEWLADPNNPDVATALMAAGNAGHDELVAAIEPHFDHADAELRGHALNALRKMSPEEAYPRLVLGARDEDARVRAQALGAAASVARRTHEPPPAPMIEDAASSLGAATGAEERAAIELLTVAAASGERRAQEHLRDEFAAELNAEEREPTRLAALGRSAGRWRAGD